MLQVHSLENKRPAQILYITKPAELFPTKPFGELGTSAYS